MASSDRIVVERFATTDIPPQQRYDAWVNRGAPGIAPLYRTTPLEPFDTASELFRLGAVSVFYCTMTAQRWERDSGTIRAGNADGLTVAITLAGEAHGIMAGKAFRTSAGSVHLVDLAQPSHHESTASRTILITVPRARATAAGLDVSSLHGFVVNSAAGAMLISHVLRLREAAGEFTQAESSRLAQTLIELIVLAVRASLVVAGNVAGGRGAIAALLARDTIERRLESPTLNIASLCRQLGISRTTLHRLFEAEGGAQAYIRSRRLERARAALLDPANNERIGAIAERLCFSDSAHLSRLFRQRYRQSPSEFRASRGEGGAETSHPGIVSGPSAQSRNGMKPLFNVVSASRP